MFSLTKKKFSTTRIKINEETKDNRFAATRLKQRTKETNVPIIPAFLDRNKAQENRSAFMKNAIVGILWAQKKKKE